VKEVTEVPQRHDSSLWKIVGRIVAAEQLHAHDGEDKDNDGQHEAEVAERAQSSANNTHQHVQCRPELGQLEDPQLQLNQIKPTIAVLLVSLFNHDSVVTGNAFFATWHQRWWFGAVLVRASDS